MPPAGSFPEEVCRRDAGHFLEAAGEVVRELEAQHVGGFVDIVAVHQEVLALFDHERVDRKVNVFYTNSPIVIH